MQMESIYYTMEVSWIFPAVSSMFVFKCATALFAFLLLACLKKRFLNSHYTVVHIS